MAIENASHGNHITLKTNVRGNRGLAFTPLPRTLGSMPRGGARGQNLEHLEKCIF